VVSRSRKARRRSQLAVFQEELEPWIGAEVRVWYFSCTHNRFVLRLTRLKEGNREFKFLAFLDCGPIEVRNLGHLADVAITDLRGKRWRMEAVGISIECYACSIQDLSAEALQDMSGIAPPILLGEKFGDFHIPRMAPLLIGGGHYGYGDEQEPR